MNHGGVKLFMMESDDSAVSLILTRVFNFFDKGDTCHGSRLSSGLIIQ